MSPLLAAGREADVYALDGDRVLRRYRAGGDATHEAAVMSYLRSQGLPVPRVYEAAGADLVMERIQGRSLLAALMDGDVAPAVAGELLADLLARLHALPARLSSEPDTRILHMDLHPDNVILAPAGGRGFLPAG